MQRFPKSSAFSLYRYTLVVRMEHQKISIEGLWSDDEVLVSPTGQYFNSSVLSISVLSVLESEIPIDDSPTLALLKDLFLPINPRFSSMVLCQRYGVKQWNKVEVKLQDHVNVPTFPQGKSPEFYDACLNDYLSKIALELFPQGRPLWNIHIFKYPTINSASDFGWSLLKSSFLQDDRTPIRSGVEGVEFLPMNLITMSLSLDQIKEIMVNLSVTINDVLTGNVLTRISLSARHKKSSKRDSAGVFLTGRLLETVRKYRGPEATAQYIRSTLKNSSMTVSNMIGPLERMSLANHPVKGFYFMVVGVPQVHTITMVSYMNVVRIAVGTEKGLMDPQKYKSSAESAFDMIYKAIVKS
ncbi:hypothetical protein POM88_004913 [Heracleum sosnowskyi]|uniref:O-acyltransferase WSD1 C-terminal domain-containing protein n=1 Tax=Heracleum sosnowskyi TaxID=360622 RepID=A0AAD8JKB4_9APIA|nr:hypothetical protein POM88_004913 [Heracleum sosnowskyi]